MSTDYRDSESLIAAGKCLYKGKDAWTTVYRHKDMFELRVELKQNPGTPISIDMDIEGARDLSCMLDIMIKDAEIWKKEYGNDRI